MPATGNAGVVIANTVTVSAHDDDSTAASTATASDAVTYQDVAPAITVTKTHSGTIAEGTADQTLTYRFTVTNTSTATTDPVTVTSLTDTVLGDLLSAFTTANGGSVTLAFGASKSFDVVYSVPTTGNAGVVIANTVTVSAHDDDSTAASTATASDAVTYQDVAPAITVTKTHSGTIAEGTADQTLTYRFTVTNTSTATTDPVTVTSLTDTLLGDLLSAFTTANGGSATLAFGASKSFDVVYSVPATGNAGVVIANTVTVSAHDDDSTAASTATASDAVTYQDVAPAITVTKTHSGTIAEGTADQTLTYRFTVTNTSTATTDPVTVTSLTDTVLGDLLSAFTTANGGSATLAFGASKSFDVVYSVPATGNAGVVIANTVTVSAHDDDSTAASTATASDAVTYQDVAPAITVTKSHTGVIAEGTAGQTLTYRFTVTNTSTATTDPVTVTSLTDTLLGDLLSAFTTANGGSATLAFGASKSFDVVYSVPATGNAGVVIANTVTVSAHDDDSTAASTATASDAVTYQDVAPAITVTKSHSGTIAEGTADQTLTYRFTVTNTSTATTDPVTVTSLTDTVLGDLLSAFTTANGGSATLAFGASKSFDVVYSVPATGNAGVVIANTVTVSAHDDDSTAASTATASDAVTYQDVAPAITVTKTHSGTINEGTADQTLTYRFTVTNTSTATTDPVTVTSLTDTVLGDLLSAFTTANGGSATLAFGASKSFDVVYSVPATGNAGVVIANTVTVSAHDDDSTAASTATASDAVTYQDVAPAITIVKTVAPASVLETGGTVTYTYTLTNTSLAGAYDPLTITSLVDDQAGNILADGTFVGGDTNSNGKLDAGEIWVYTITQTVPAGNVGDSFTNNVTVNATDDEGTPTSDNSSATVTYVALPTLQVTAFTPTATGFIADFNRLLNTGTPLAPVLNLYDNAAGSLGPTDVTLVNHTGSGDVTIRGSLVVSTVGGNSQIQFIETGESGVQGSAATSTLFGVLPNGTYTVTLRSATNGFKDMSNNLLDGNADGTPGNDYVTTFVVNNSSDSVTVTLPDFARGAGQLVNVPNTASADDTFTNGLPLRLFNGISFTGSTTKDSPTVQVLTTAGLNNGDTVTGPPGMFPDGTTIISVDSDTQIITLSQPAGATSAALNYGGVVLNDSTGSQTITSVSLTLAYDPSLLSVTGYSIDGLSDPGDSSVTTFDTSTAGLVKITFTTSTGIVLSPGGSQTFLSLKSNVPSTAGYEAKEILDLKNIAIGTTTGAITPIDDAAIHAAGYLGDAAGLEITYTGQDALDISRVAVGLDAGFKAWVLADPLIVGDISGDHVLTGLDALEVARQAVGITQSTIPVLKGLTPALLGPDPVLNIPETFSAVAGSTLQVPVNLNHSDGLDAVDLAISYDTSRLDVLSPSDIKLGSLTGASGTDAAGNPLTFNNFVVNLDRANGIIRLIGYRTAGPLHGLGSGSLAIIDFQVKSDAPVGAAIVNLMQNVGGTWSLPLGTDVQGNDFAFDLQPRASNAAGDPLDGRINVLPAPTTITAQVSASSTSGPLVSQLDVGRIDNPSYAGLPAEVDIGSAPSLAVRLVTSDAPSTPVMIATGKTVRFQYVPPANGTPVTSGANDAAMAVLRSLVNSLTVTFNTPASSDSATGQGSRNNAVTEGVAPVAPLPESRNDLGRPEGGTLFTQSTVSARPEVGPVRTLGDDLVPKTRDRLLDEFFGQYPADDAGLENPDFQSVGADLVVIPPEEAGFPFDGSIESGLPWSDDFQPR